jgi:hypothetical protein
MAFLREWRAVFLAGRVGEITLSAARRSRRSRARSAAVREPLVKPIEIGACGWTGNPKKCSRGGQVPHLDAGPPGGE